MSRYHDIKMKLVISVSVVTAVVGQLLLTFVGFAISLPDDLKFLFEGDATLSTCSFERFIISIG